MKEENWTILNYVLCTIAISLFLFGGYLHFKYADSLLWMLTPSIVFLIALFLLIIYERNVKKSHKVR